MMAKYKTKKPVPTVSKKEFIEAVYAITVMPDGDEDEPGFIAKAAELPGLLGYGSTEGEAITDFHEVKGDWYDSAVEMNVPFTLPKQEVAPEYSGKFVLRMSADLHKAVSNLAEASEMSLNSYIVQSLRDLISGKDHISDLQLAEMQSMIRETVRQEIRTQSVAVTPYKQTKTGSARPALRRPAAKSSCGIVLNKGTSGRVVAKKVKK